MRCPFCKNPMVVLELAAVEIDHCFSCGGIWLDSGELELLLEGAVEKENLLTSFAVDKDTKEKSIKCPICAKRMEKVFCGKGVKRTRLDKCSNNDGIWFDKGELQDVLEIGCFDKNNRILDLLKDMFAGKNLKKEDVK